MDMTLSITDKRTIHLPLERYSRTPATNSANPYESIGVIHNAVFDYVRTELISENYRGSTPSVDSIISATSNVVENTPLWNVSCVCTTPENCPCDDYADFIRLRLMPKNNRAPLDLSKEVLMSLHSNRDEIEKLALSHITDDDHNMFIAFWRELQANIDRLSIGRSDRSARVFQEAVVKIETFIIEANMTSSAKEALLAATSVARHSLMLALESRIAATDTPRWVKSDVVGGLVGGLLGGATGALIGAAAASLSEAVLGPGSQ